MIGKNNSFKIGRTNEYRIVTTILAIIIVVILEKPTVGNAQARIPSVNAVIRIALNIYSKYRKVGSKSQFITVIQTYLANVFSYVVFEQIYVIHL